ncbi:MAG: M23 family metallopeptidase [Hyphomicrobiales bacterium]
MMRVLLAITLALLTSEVRAEAPGHSTAIVVAPIHDAQVVRGDDGRDHVEYELLVINAFAGPVTLANVVVVDPAGNTLATIAGPALAAATQTLLTQSPGATIPASAVVSVDIDLALTPGAAPASLSHRIAYTIAPDAPMATLLASMTVEGPVVSVDRAAPFIIKPPLKGKGWFAVNGCCGPNVHRDTRIAIDGSRIATSETFAIDWTRVENGRMFEGDGGKNEQHYAFGADLLAVAAGTVVATRDGMPEEAPFKPVLSVKAPEDYGGNHVIIEIAPKVFAVYAHVKTGSVAVKVGDRVKAGDVVGRLGNSGNSTAPHLHFALLDKPNFFAGRSLPYVIDAFTYAGTARPSDLTTLNITGDPRPVSNAYPLYLGLQDYP